MKESKYLEEKNELVDIVHCAFNDWDDYNEECYESHISPQEEVEDFVADAVLHAGYRKQERISIEEALPRNKQGLPSVARYRGNCYWVLQTRFARFCRGRHCFGERCHPLDAASTAAERRMNMEVMIFSIIALVIAIIVTLKGE